jgi:hypothetical protein
MKRTTVSHTSRLGFICVFGLFSAVPLSAQRPLGGDGYLFSPPRVHLELETGYGLQLAGGQLFDQVLADHTLGGRDFDSPLIGAELGVRITERWDLGFSIGLQESRASSEYTEWVDQDDQPIEQVTKLRLVPAVVSVRYYLNDRGRKVGSFAWIPERFTPFVGLGAGVLSYRFQQRGDFIDFQTFGVHRDDLVSEGSTTMARATAGATWAFHRQLFLSAEGRWAWARGDVGGDFQGFDAMHLDGLQLALGFGVYF